MASVFFPIVMIVSFMVFGIVSALGIITWMRSHRLRVRDPLNKTRYITDYWVLEKMDKATDTPYWGSVFWQKKLKVDLPPKEATEVGKKGRKFAECYILSGGERPEVVWITDKGVTIKEKEVDGKIELQIVDIQEDGTYKYIDTFKPFTTTQRDSLVGQFKKADEISKKRWSVGEVMGMASMGGLVLVIICGLLFGADLLAEYRDSRVVNQQLVQQQAEVTKAQAALIQALGIDVSEMDITIAQAPPKQQGQTIASDTDTMPAVVQVLKGQLE